MTKHTIVLLCASLWTSAALAQSNNWRLSFVTGDTLSRVTLVSLSSDTLFVLHQDTSCLIPVGSINELRLVKESATWETAKQYGTIAGITGGIVAGTAIAVSVHGGSVYSLEVPDATAKILGALTGAIVYGTASAILGGAIGSVVGGIKGADEVYDLSHLSVKGKIFTIQGILSLPLDDDDD